METELLVRQDEPLGAVETIELPAVELTDVQKLYLAAKQRRQARESAFIEERRAAMLELCPIEYRHHIDGSRRIC